MSSENTDVEDTSKTRRGESDIATRGAAPSDVQPAKGRAAAHLAVLLSGEDRDRAYVLHPLSRNKQRLATPAIERLFPNIQHAITFCEHGHAWQAEPKNGKTSAIEIVEELLAEIYPHLPVFVTSAAKHGDQTEKTQWKDILEDLGVASKDRAHEMRSDLINLFTLAAVTNNSESVILIIDEAQNYTEEQWEFLKGIVVALDRRKKILLTCFVFGQPQLKARRNDLLKARRTDLVTRFMPEMHEFLGLKNVTELKRVFKQFDDSEKTEYPEDSGICFTEFFMPQAYAAGWRLENEIPELWRAFVRTAVKFKALKIHSAVQAIKAFFIANKSSDSAQFTGNPEMWDKAVRRSSFFVLHE